MERKKILVAPLDWGLGHATRCIPVINALLKKNIIVEIGGSGPSLSLLKQTFPSLNFHTLPGTEIKYPDDYWGSIQILRQAGNFIASIKKEKMFLDNFLINNKFDAIISDNRYGLYSDKLHCILITHQLKLKLPSSLRLFDFLIQNTLTNYINKFDRCWIPDYAGRNNLSGSLSHISNFDKTKQFIGPLSRFHNLKDDIKIDLDFNLLAIISGPEPQRTIFEKLIETQSRKYNISTLIIQGIPGLKNNLINDGLIKKISYADHIFIKSATEKTDGIIARAGYSTIMDLVALKKSALLVPTPGQTEQEYLAVHDYNKQFFQFSTQKSIDVRKALSPLPVIDFPEYNTNMLNVATEELVSNIK